MARKVILKITEEDIQGAKRCSTSNCPVARAFIRITGIRVNVHSNFIIERSAGNPICKLPPMLADAIGKYDFSGKMMPESWEIEVDD